MVLNEQSSSPSPVESELHNARPVHCPRCQGFLIPVWYGEWGRITATQTAHAWSCVQCGAIIDPVIMANRCNRRIPAVSTHVDR